MPLPSWILTCVVLNVVVSIIARGAQSEEGGKGAEECGERRRVVRHVSHSTRDIRVYAYRIERGVGVYVVGYEFHRRHRYKGLHFGRRSDNKLGSLQEIKIENSRRYVDSMRDSAWVATEEAERKAARTNDTTPVTAPPCRTESVEKMTGCMKNKSG